MLRLFLIAALLFNSVFSAYAAEEVFHDVHYGPDRSQIFDLWTPNSEKPTPLVIFIHGGGFTQGSKEDFTDHRIRRKYLRSGIAFASINYRFLDRASLQTIMREDIAGFVQHIRFEAKKYNLDKKLVFSFGYSAGGSASLWLGTHPDLAQRWSFNPEKRESTRVVAVGHLNAQISYDFIQWFKVFGKNQTQNFLGDEVWSRYRLTSLSDLYTPQGKLIRKDLDMLGNMSKDDAPVFFWNSYPDVKSGTREQFLHSPDHARILYNHAMSVGLEARLVLEGNRLPMSDVMLQLYKFFLEKIRHSRPFFQAES